MLSIEILEKELNNEKLQSLYLLYGEELFLLELCLKKIKKQFGDCTKGINYITIDDTNYNELIADIETPSFGYDKKLIVVRNSGLLKKEGKRKNVDLVKAREKLNEYINNNIEQINESVVLVFIEEDSDIKLDLYKTIDKLGVICKFDYQKPAQIIVRLKNICNSYKIKIDDSTVRYFIECSRN